MVDKQHLFLKNGIKMSRHTSSRISLSRALLWFCQVGRSGGLLTSTWVGGGIEKLSVSSSKLLAADSSIIELSVPKCIVFNNGSPKGRTITIIELTT